MDETRYRDAEQRFWQSVGVEPTERRLHLDRLDTEIRVQEVGDGPLVVFVHGGSASGANWAPLVADLDGFRCVVIDRPGCGLSPPLYRDLTHIGPFWVVTDALVVDVLDALDAPTGHVVATSLGGLVRVARCGCPSRAGRSYGPVRLHARRRSDPRADVDADRHVAWTSARDAVDTADEVGGSG